MSMVGGIGVGDLPAADARAPGRGLQSLGDGSGGGQKFRDMLEGLGGKSSQADSGSGAGEEPQSVTDKRGWMARRALAAAYGGRSDAAADDADDEAVVSPQGLDEARLAASETDLPEQNSSDAEDPTREWLAIRPRSGFGTTGPERPRRRVEDADKRARDGDTTQSITTDDALAAPMQVAMAAIGSPDSNTGALSSSDVLTEDAEHRASPLIALSAKVTAPEDGDSGADQKLWVPLTVLGEETHFAGLRPNAIAGGDHDRGGDTADEAPESGTADDEKSADRLEHREAKAAEANDPVADDAGDASPSPARVELAPAAAPPSAAPQSPVRQITQAVLDSLPSDPVAAPAGDQASAGQPVKVLNIRLDPPEYGSVTVRLKLNGTALSLQLQTEREETAHVLRREKDKLADALRAEGYDTDVGMIDLRRDLPLARADLPQGNPPNGSAGGNHNLAQAGGDRAPSQRGGRQFAGDSQPGSNGTNDANPDPGRSAGALYV